jgi:hypothetical protein
MTRPFRDVPEPALENQRMLIRLRPAVPPDLVDRAHMPYPSRFVSFTRDELPC